MTTKNLAKNAEMFDILDVYSSVKTNGRTHVRKIHYMYVKADRKNGNTKLLRVNSENRGFLEVFTSCFFHTRLNGQKLSYWAFTRVFENPCLLGRELNNAHFHLYYYFDKFSSDVLFGVNTYHRWIKEY